MIVYLMMIDSPKEKSKFEKIYLEYKGLMYHVAYKILNNEFDAEDAVHSAFVKVAENISKIEQAVCPKTQCYVVTIVENKAIDIYRKKQRKKQVEYSEAMVGIVIDSADVHGLARCISRLRPRYRQIIFLKYYYGFNNREIAKQMDITVINAIKLDQRAKKQLQEICKQEGIL